MPCIGKKLSLSSLLLCLYFSISFAQSPPDSLSTAPPIVASFLKAGEFDIALQKATQLLGEAPQDSGYVHFLAGKAAIGLHDDSTALSHLRTAQKLMRAQPPEDATALPDAAFLLGRIAYRAKRFAAARDHFESALHEWLQLPQTDSAATARTMLQLGKTVRQLGEYKRALEMFEQARAMGNGYTDRKDFDRMLSYLYAGNVFYTMDQYTEAEAAYKKALAIEQASSNPRLNAVIPLMNNVAATLDQQGQFSKAIRQYQQALEQARRYYGPESPNTIGIYGNIGLVHQRMGKQVAAERYYRQACDMALEALGPTHPYTGEVMAEYASFSWENDQPRQALELIQAALVATAPDALLPDWRTHPNINDVVDFEQFRSNIAFKGALLARLPESILPQDSALHLALQCYDLYAAATDKSWEYFSDTRDKLYLNRDGLQAYENAIRCADRLFQLTGEPHFQEKIFAYMERSKYQVMLESIQEGRAAFLGGIPLATRQRSKSLREIGHELAFALQQAQLSTDSAVALRNRLFKTRLQLSQLTDSLERAFPGYAQMHGRRHTFSFAEILAKCSDPKTAVIEYFIGDSSIFVLAGHAGEAQFRETPLAPGFRDSVRAFQSLVQLPHPTRARLDRYQKLAYFLFQTLLEPELTDLPQNVSHLRIVPDDLLGLIPFDALTSGYGPADPRSHGQLPLLIYDYQVSYAPSANLLFTPRPPTDAPLSCLGFSWNATSDEVENASRLVKGQKWPSLPGTEAELAMIEQWVQGRYFRGQAATEAAFKAWAPQYGLLHLALHGYSAGEEPYILFPAPGEGEEDGILYLHELYSLSLQARLAVLSACETGGGQVTRGEGVMSVASGFASAGCPSVLMSLWPVDDQAGSAIIQQFYQEMIKGESLNVAMHSAKLKFLKSGGSFRTAPFYWAPYILLGDSSPIIVARQTQWTWAWWLGGLSLALILSVFILKLRLKNR